MWETVETGAREIGVGKTERRGGKRGSREEKGGKGEEEETEKGKSSGSKEGSRGVGNMGRRRRSGKVGGRGKEIGTGKVSPVDKSVWEKAVGENAHEEIVGPHNRNEGGVCSEEGKSVSVVKRRERGGERVCERTVEKGIHLAVQVTLNGAGILCRKEGGEKEDGARLSLSE